MDKSAKVEKLKSGYTMTMKDGEKMALMDLNAVLNTGLSIAGDGDGINILTMANKIREELLPYFVKDDEIKYRIYLNILNCDLVQFSQFRIDCSLKE